MLPSTLLPLPQRKRWKVEVLYLGEVLGSAKGISKGHVESSAAKEAWARVQALEASSSDGGGAGEGRQGGEGPGLGASSPPD